MCLGHLAQRHKLVYFCRRRHRSAAPYGEQWKVKWKIRLLASTHRRRTRKRKKWKQREQYQWTQFVEIDLWVYRWMATHSTINMLETMKYCMRCKIFANWISANSTWCHATIVPWFRKGKSMASCCVILDFTATKSLTPNETYVPHVEIQLIQVMPPQHQF